MSKINIKKSIFLKLVPKKLRNRIVRALMKIPELPDGLTFKIARSKEDLDAAFKIVYQAYLKEGLTPPSPMGRRIISYNALPSTTTLVVKQNQIVVATASIVRDGVFGVPADGLFDLSKFRNSGKRFAEISSYAISPDLKGKSPEIILYLFKYIFKYSHEYFGVDRILIVFHPSRMMVYEGVFLFKPLQKKIIDHYSFVNNAPAVSASINLETAEERYLNIYKGKENNKNMHRFFYQPLSSKETLAMQFPERSTACISDPVMSPEYLDYFFNTCSQVFETMTEKEIQYLHDIYSHPDYKMVLPKRSFQDPMNQRCFPRYETKCFGLVSPDGQNAPVFINILDVSAKGMQICTTAPVNLSGLLTFIIITGKHTISIVKGTIRWRQNEVCGIAFSETDNRWNRFIEIHYNRQNQVTTMSEQSLDAAS